MFEEVEAEHVPVEPTLDVVELATLPEAWEVIVELFGSILHILDETLHQVASKQIIDMMLQAQ